MHTAVVEANYDWTFVRVDADGEGLSGIGECFCAPGLTGIVRDLAPLLIGEDARDVDRLWAKLRWGCSGAGSSAGIVYNAISGIEAAVWDLVGQLYGVPIHRLLGGRFRDSVRMYADCHAGEALHSMDATMVERPARWGQEPPEAVAAGSLRNPEHGRAYAKGIPDEVFTPELYAARARQVVADLGFSALKFDLDVPTPYMQDTASGTLSRAEIKYMVELAAAVIDAVGDEVDVAFDCHWRYQVSDACRLAHELEDLGLMWLEDPVPPENVAGAGAGDEVDLDADRHGRERLHAPRLPGGVRGGGDRHRRARSRRRRAGCWRRGGSPTTPTRTTSRWRRTASRRRSGRSPTCTSPPRSRTSWRLEWHGMSVPFWNDLAVGFDGPVISEGRIRVPDAPGLGVTLNLDLAREYARPGEPFFDE